MDELYQKLKDYRNEGVYPFHMPGHKRNPVFSSWELPFDRDITEIDGFDNLHHAEGILKDTQERISRLYGSKKCWLSVNGSTAAVLSMISAAIKPGEKILMARNCHKSVYHAAYLRRLKLSYVYPRPDCVTGINADVDPEEVRNALEADAEIKAVVLTSPTYDGVVSDIREISRIVHEYNIPLLVDEAHGAHFRFSDYFPGSAVDEGADVVAQSFHKTLPAMTQTAVLHLCSDRVAEEEIEKYMGIFQTSSPSYVLMSSLDQCAAFLEKKGEEAFAVYTERLDRFRRRIGEGSVLKPGVPSSCFGFDRSRILLMCRDGFAMAQRFRQEFRLEPEMAAPGYVLMLSTVGDTEEGFERLFEAVNQIRGDLRKINDDENMTADKEASSLPDLFHHRLSVKMTVENAMDAPSRPVCTGQSGDCISSESVYLYPPGIPIVVPGELITKELARQMQQYVDGGVSLQGLSDHSGRTIKVVYHG